MQKEPADLTPISSSLSEPSTLEIDNIIKNELLTKDHFSAALDKLTSLAMNGYGNLIQARLLDMAMILDSPDDICVIKAKLYERVGDKDNALLYYQKSYEIKPSESVLAQIHWILYSKERYQEALDVANLYIERYPNGMILKVKTLLKILPANEAVSVIDNYLDSVTEIEKKFSESIMLEKAAELCFESGMFDKALEYADRAILSYKPAKTVFALKDRIIQKISDNKIQ